MSRYDVLPLLVIICDLKFCSNMYSSLDIGSEEDKKNITSKFLDQIPVPGCFLALKISKFTKICQTYW